MESEARGCVSVFRSRGKDLIEVLASEAKHRTDVTTLKTNINGYCKYQFVDE